MCGGGQSGNIWPEGCWVSRYNGTKWTSFTTANGLTNNRSMQLIRTGKVCFLCGSSITGMTVRPFLPDIPDDYFNCMAVDSKGNKWFGASINGLIKYDKIRVRDLYHE